MTRRTTSPLLSRSVSLGSSKRRQRLVAGTAIRRSAWKRSPTLSPVESHAVKFVFNLDGFPPSTATLLISQDGNEEVVLVVFHDNGNNANQLDQNPRSFFLAENPARGQHQEQYKQRGQGRPHQQLGNVFRGFDTKTIAEVFKVDEETARKLQGQNEERGHIVTVDEGLQVIRPPSEYSRREREEEERYYGGRPSHQGDQFLISSGAMDLKSSTEEPNQVEQEKPY
ncbi:11S globulin-like protein [Striga asiatica]|uniref:11S globulin-like protein n=1 Tax=Striga asiatica TaxID=4170 RepID=A0A5A7P162_STRAF|nr:11S globulin-like protein [Striga asiatica]